jgi:hypothetical protein
MVKPGPIIGLVIGILMAVFPIIGFLTEEGSLSDPKGKMIGFGFIIFGAFMVIVNIIALAKGTDNIFSSSNETTTATQIPAKTSSQSQVSKIRCRFCKKLYSTEYNGCPYCKKK